jgi:excinuclease UvrABC ATPase subunit
MRTKRNQKVLTKKDFELFHARKRLKERYDIFFSKDMKKSLKIMIKEHQCKVVKEQSLRTVVLEAEWEGIRLKFVWDKKRESFVTFLPIE